MDYDDGFILQKDVNWSLLNEGLAIPISVYARFNEWDASILKHGAGKQTTGGYYIFMQVRHAFQENTGIIRK